MGDLASFLPLLLILLVFWLLIIRPTRARQRAAVALQGQLAPGQLVVTTAGLHATVAAVEDDVVLLETSPGVTSRWAKAAIARVVQPPGEQDGMPPGRGADRGPDQAPGPDLA